MTPFIRCIFLLLVLLCSCRVTSLSLPRSKRTLLRNRPLFRHYGKTTTCSRTMIMSSTSPTVTSSSTPNIECDMLGLEDMLQVLKFAVEEFDGNCSTINEHISLRWEILCLFLPKFLFPQRMAHSVIGLRLKEDEEKSKKLIGFVDVSLQPCDGELHALDPLSLEERKLRHPTPGILQPYVCNLLVSPVYRGRGYGRVLMQACEVEAKKWGYDNIFLHVEKTGSALGFYLRLDFEPVKDISRYFFMKKSLGSTPL